MQPTKEQIQELRTNFLKKLNESGGESVVHPNDLERVKSSDDWLRRFLMHHDLDMNEAVKMMWESCEWRKKFGTNDINETNIRMDYLAEGNFFAHGKDIDGCTMLIFKSKKHIKGQKDFEELKRCVVYWFERLEREFKGAPITIFFDLEGCGLSNLDMEFTKYLIGLFKLYYPFFLNYIIIYEMAWILNAAFKIIKQLLPEKAVVKMKFVNKGSLKEFVSPDQALQCWGGENGYVFSFIPENREQNMAVANSPPSNKKVHFADGSPMTEQPAGYAEKDGFESGMLTINPSACLTFVQDGAELSSTVSLTNDMQYPISYKMKTTAPEKFRVRPSAGILTPGATHSITLTLLPGFQLGGLSRDKFLVMSTPVDSPDMSPQELSDLWKNMGGKNITQHKLRCSQTGIELAKNGSAVNSAHSDNEQNQLTLLTSNINKLLECQGRLHNDVKFTNRLQYLNLLLIICLAAGVIIMLNTQYKENIYQECPRQI